MQNVYKHCKDLDKRCYEQYHLSEDLLMEHAALGMAGEIRAKFAKSSTLLIISGKGNNGADGVALARLLHGDYIVKLYIPFGISSDMAKIQMQRALAVGVMVVDDISECDVVVDCILGSGSKGEIDSEIVELIEKLNRLNGYKISCDIPTGISSSAPFRADMTITMGAYKEILYSDHAKDFVGEVVRVDLGLHHTYYEDDSDTYLLQESDIVLPIRKQLSTHKGNFGHAVVFCGEKEGAGIISAEAAYRFGAGLTTLVMLEKHQIPPYLMHSYIPPHNTTAIAIGMGLGDHFEESFLDKHIASNDIPLIIDADALYQPKLLKLFMKTKREMVLTPHPKEFIFMWKALSGEDITLEHLQQNRFEYARKFSALYPDVVLLLKGANMLITHQNRVYINPLGNQNLSKGGSGDVLSGLIVSLLAQGYTALEAAIHGSLALALSAVKYDGANYSMSSMDLIDNLRLL